MTLFSRFRETFWQRASWKLFALLLLLDTGARMVAITRPIIDAHDIRQAHTAILTQNLREDGFPPVKTRGDWNGFENATVVLELPIMNHVAGRLFALTHSLEAAGRLVAIAASAAAFWLFFWLCLQTLPWGVTRWAATVFAFSPLGIFFGQSFQPEAPMLCLSLAILCAFWKWRETEQHRWLLVFLLVLALGITIKLNEISHLAFPVLALGLTKWGPRFLLKWQTWLIGAVGGAVTIVWSKVITHFNASSFPDWSASSNLRNFIGTLNDRLHAYYYLKLAGYMGGLGLTPVLGLFFLTGVVVVWRRRDSLYVWWGAGIGFFYLLWGPGGPVGHSYYHLVALPWFCVVAAFGLDGALAEGGWLAARRLGISALALLWTGFFGAALTTLYYPDHTAYSAARAVAALQPPKSEGLIVAADHRRASSGWPLYPTIFFYSGMKGYNLPLSDREVELATLIDRHPELRWVVQTRFTPQADIAMRNRIAIFSRTPVIQPALDEPLTKLGFVKVSMGPDFSVFHKP
ncbi:MAG: glycosyltransferase family 39 protein [Chthoniobacter sp.]|nr:glycosyltransferase family 39 protein [Chthoniobacter sp.]